VAVHYAGVGCDIAGLQEVLAPYPDITLIEDNAHGLFGHYRGEPLGSFGRFSTLSFHETKNFVCGEGGALVINDSADVERAHTILDKGTNRRSFALGKVDKYTWIDTGSSFGLADLLAAYLLGQLEAKEEILDLRKEAFNRYYEWLSPYQDDYGYRIPVIPADRVPAYHMFYTIVEDERTRNHVLSEMGDQGLEAVFHYVPLHSSPGGLQAAAGESHCPVTTDISRRLLRLPFHNMLSDEDSKLVVEAFLEAVSSANG
jgi:dTDP-4-amino-4,6-dideoxygalactose transaminase